MPDERPPALAAVLAERCRRELDRMDYCEGTARRDAIILRHIKEALAPVLEPREALLEACKAALRHLQAEVEDEVHEGREGPACKLHDRLLAAVASAEGGP